MTLVGLSRPFRIGCQLFDLVHQIIEVGEKSRRAILPILIMVTTHLLLTCMGYEVVMCVSIPLFLEELHGD